MTSCPFIAPFGQSLVVVKRLAPTQVSPRPPGPREGILVALGLTGPGVDAPGFHEYEFAQEVRSAPIVAVSVLSEQRAAV